VGGTTRLTPIAEEAGTVQAEGVNAPASIKAWVRSLKRDVVALWVAARDPRVPLHVKALAGAVATYALSPIDLIPDFIPILGYLDDLLIVAAGISLAVRLIPAPLMREFRDEAKRRDRPTGYAGLVFVSLVWMSLAAAIAWLIFSK
jgi:uncharacterized membrane protein YkvA (DUF1232 family)